jgi:hypothetical protein
MLNVPKFTCQEKASAWNSVVNADPGPEKDVDTLPNADISGKEHMGRRVSYGSHTRRD